MRLRVLTPSGPAIDVTGVRHVRAEDATGAFGILPGHTELVTTLAVSVLSWRDARGAEHHAAIRNGVLHVHDGTDVEVATREAVLSDDLGQLQGVVLARLRDRAEAEAKARTGAARLHASVVRHLFRYLRGERSGGQPELRGRDEEGLR